MVYATVFVNVRRCSSNHFSIAILIDWSSSLIARSYIYFFILRWNLMLKFAITMPCVCFIVLVFFVCIHKIKYWRNTTIFLSLAAWSCWPVLACCWPLPWQPIIWTRRCSMPMSTIWTPIRHSGGWARDRHSNVPLMWHHNTLHHNWTSKAIHS